MKKITSHIQAQKLGYVGGIKVFSKEVLSNLEINTLLKAFKSIDAGFKVNSKSVIIYYPEGKCEEYKKIVYKNMNCK